MAKQFKYIKKMTELGFTEDTVSKGIKEQIQFLKNAQAALAQTTDETERADIESDINIIDEELVTAITKYPAKLENARKMQEGKKAKQAERASATPAVAPTIVVAPVVETPATIAADGGQTGATPVTETKEEKKGGGGLWTILGVVGVGVLAVFGWKAYQNR